MPNIYISEPIRRFVAQRATNKCEYCLIDEDDTYLSCEVDHIISVKHGGGNDENNLAFACLPCNRYKGSDIATLNESGEIVGLFNPRLNDWQEHFTIAQNQIIGLTAIGKATVKLLQLNNENRLEERAELQKIGRYPTE